MSGAEICFVIPPSPFLLDERVFVSLGILKVAAACEARGRRVEVLDLSGVENFEEVAALHAARTTARVFALTATTPQMPAAVKIARTIGGEASERTKLILGGPHVTLVAAAAKLEAKRRPGQLDRGRATRALAQLREMFDVVVAGDGERGIEAALRLDRGLVDADDPGGPFFIGRKEVEELPPPARHLVDLESYRYTIDGAKSTSLIAQLGCPFACNFCGGRNSPMLRRARFRSPEAVVAEVEQLYRTYGYTGFMLYDDELNVDGKRLVEMMRQLILLQGRLGVEFRLRGFIKAELFTREQAEAMRDAGFRWILTGFESGSPRILENIQKRATVEDNDRCVAFARAAGLKVKALMSIGHAGESALTVSETKAWLLSVRPEDFDCTVITPYPGSPYYDEADPGVVQARSGGTIWTYTYPKNGDRLHALEVDYAKTADYYKGAPGEYRSYVFTDHLEPDELCRLRDELEADVRDVLGLAFNVPAAVRRYEHSMGQGPLPPNLLRSTE